MTTLSFLGLSTDGSALLLSGPQGKKYSLPIDERLRSATRGGKTATPDIDLRDSTIGPREIQQRVRAGATPEEVAEFASWPIERVRAFAVPVEQERQYMAELAQESPIGRNEDAPTLEQIVSSRLDERGVDQSTVRWDSWRREDGSWTILCSFPAGKGDRVATWSFDAATKQLCTEDDEARWFTEDRLPSDTGPRLVQIQDDEQAVGLSQRYDDEYEGDPEPDTSAADVEPEVLADVSPNHPAAQGRTPRPVGADSHPAGRASKPKVDAPRHEVPKASPAVVDAPSWDQVLFGSSEDAPTR